MTLDDQIAQWFAGLANIAFGFLLGSIITGWFTWKVVVPKVMQNHKVQRLLELLEKATDLLEKIEKNHADDHKKDGK